MWGCGKVPGPASHSLSKAGIISQPVGHPLKDPLPSKIGGRDTPTEGLSTRRWPQKPSGQEVSLSGKTLEHFARPPPHQPSCPDLEMPTTRQSCQAQQKGWHPSESSPPCVPKAGPGREAWQRAVHLLNTCSIQSGVECPPPSSELGTWEDHTSLSVCHSGLSRIYQPDPSSPELSYGSPTRKPKEEPDCAWGSGILTSSSSDSKDTLKSPLSTLLFKTHLCWDHQPHSIDKKTEAPTVQLLYSSSSWV